MDRESGLWIPASAHKGGDDEEEYDEEHTAEGEDESALNGETRGRQEAVPA